MTKKMLIDASHPEETRDLARVTRVEPSLQAAFVEYGGNRHGFLAFSEIHPDYYQIPHEDKLALLEAEEAEHLEAEADADEDSVKASEDSDDDAEDSDNQSEDDDRDENVDPDADDVADADDEEVAEEQVKVASKRRKRMSRRRYKIQEVIKRGQILLIQAVKEERGNKGAAMTTYLSLAGRYCVLMPNTARGGGISRKIANSSDRKRLKTIMGELQVPQGMGVIVRTAGAKRTKAEINRDYDYLSRLWSEIRETTLKSIAPALIHEEGNLVKRSIRDLYNKDIDEVLVQGEEAYKTAKDFIKMLMPSHAKNVKVYKDDIPLFLRYNVERQIEDSLKSVVQLKSGGYLVIHPTEALVSVDVNSGRSTKERNVERTALKTNTEAAIEVARQMRLRDLAGLIVIDFIDMDEHKNNRAVERAMKTALTQDRARVQTSRISQFGLMEISRQRRRRSLLEGSTAHCDHCEGVGRKRTIESSALAAIRAVEEVGVRGHAKRIRLKVSSDVALYIFNEKRDLLQHVDDSSGLFTELVGDEELIRPSYEIEVIEKAKRDGPDPLDEIEKEFKKQRNEAKKNTRKRKKSEEDEDDTEDSEAAEGREARDGEDEGEGRKKRRRRRGRRGGRGKRRDENTSEEFNETSEEEAGSETSEAAETEDKPKRGRGRRRKAPSRDKTDNTSDDASVEAKAETDETEDKPKRGRRKAPPKKAEAVKVEETPTIIEGPDNKPKSRSTARRKAPTKKVASKDTAKKKAPARRKATTKKVDVKESVTKLKSKAPARRKAPSKKVATEEVEAEKPKRKATTRKKAPTKKAAPKKAAAKKAPAKAKAEPKAETPAPEEKPKPAARRKAPARKVAVTEATPVKTTEAPAEKAEKKPKKRGWFGLKKK